MRGRAKGERERIIALAHQTEVMARQKTIKPLAKYLEPPKRRTRRGESDVLAMMRRLHAKQQKD